MSDRAYGKIRDIVEAIGGSMYYERAGTPFGAWIIGLDGREVRLEAKGLRAFPELDRLYVPKVADPEIWDDYTNTLIPNARELLMALLEKH